MAPKMSKLARKKELDREVECKICEKWLKRQTALRKHYVGQHRDTMEIGKRPKLRDMYNEIDYTKEHEICAIKTTVDINTERGVGPMVNARFRKKCGTSTDLIRLREIYDTELWTKYIVNASTAHGARHTVESREKAQRFYNYTELIKNAKQIEEETEDLGLCLICQDPMEKDEKIATFFKNSMEPCHPTAFHRIHFDCLELKDFNELSCPLCSVSGFYL